MSFGFGRNSGPKMPLNEAPSFGQFPRPPSATPSPPPISNLDSLSGPRFPSPRTFDAHVGVRPPSLGNARPATSSSQPYAAQTRNPILHGGDKSQSQKRPFPSTPQDLEKGITSKFPHFQNLERSRSPPIQYNEDFLRDHGDDVMERHDKKIPVIRNFGGQIQKRPFPSTPQDHERSMSKFPHYGNLERSRSPPIQYNEDFLRDSEDYVMEQRDKKNPVTRGFDDKIQKRPFPSTPQDHERSMYSNFPLHGNFERSRSPPIQYNEDFLQVSGDVNRGDKQVTRDFGGQTQKRPFPSTLQARETNFTSKTSRSPPIQYNEDFLRNPSDNVMEQHSSLSQSWVPPERSGSRNPSSQNDRSVSPVKTVETWNSKGLSSEGDFQTSLYDHQDVSKRPSLSPPKSRIGMSGVQMPGLQQKPRLSPSAHGMNGNTDITKPVSHPVSKRTRSPTSSDGQIIQMTSNSTEDGTAREEQAKAKRLARFKTELDLVEGERGGDSNNVTKGVVSKIQSVRPGVEKQKFSGDIPSGSMENQDLDNEDLQSSSAIVGVCTDMCPEPERGERERKGDLDPYERLDGDRNQTTETLAVKKYNRTAEREAELIRPLPILQKTMDYLLGLLDQPYNDRFLGLYNFMWDRMRAIRMDLRMQHIFNEKAISMLEQMIRLHILAMHELCEFSKGEGFSEGFDAHLNIEQMNKTSVELFQLYDDHRKRGIIIPTEKEFRGYYALLKLDKHPGYKVEPSELSLDLAKMTVEIRQTLEVIFARDVARSCRTFNFIAFFRHARKASYLQACLMHAHFSKLRTQALASLHSGLQYNQGIPVATIAKWLAMEGEDIDSLLEYHGFLIKEYEEPYMVKEGPFLNNEKDYPTRCSTLVHRKKSQTIMEDVLSSHQVIVLPSEPRKELQLDKHRENKQAAVEPTLKKGAHISDGLMDFESVSSPMHSMQDHPVKTSKSLQVQADLGTAKGGQPFTDAYQRVSAGSPRDKISAFASLQSHSMLDQPSPVTTRHSSLVDADQTSWKDSPKSFSVKKIVPLTKSTHFGEAKPDPFVGPVKSCPEMAVQSKLEALQPEVVSVDIAKVTPPSSEVDVCIVSSLKDDVSMNEMPKEEFNDVQQKVDDDIANNYDEEVAEAKLRLLLRLWRKRFVRKKHLREQNRLAANAALSSLSLGPPIWQHQDKPTSCQIFNIDQAMSKRYEKHQLSLARWNVSDLVESKLAEKHETSNCICWKIISFSRSQVGRSDREASLDDWLRYKLIPVRKEEAEEDLVISAPGLSVWRKWASDQSGDFRCYFSVINDTQPGTSDKKLVGVNAILFPISEILAWDIQKAQLLNLVNSLPAGACIPLLITSGSNESNFNQFSCCIVDKLGLKDLDKSRINNFMVICLNEEDQSQFNGYFSDQKLKEGLMWLASESRSQPPLFCVTVRELVSLHLNPCLDALDLMGEKVGPYQCISAFNQALDQSINDIVSAAKTNPTGWPCPELYLLDDSTAEFRAVKKFLPTLGWSSPEEVEPLISALRNCKLPSFSDDISWLNRGCNSETDIEDQKQRLQDCLIRYLAQSSNVLNLMMAIKEAHLMVQKYTRLELHDTSFKMVPSWVLIFRRVFNWQLNTSASFSSKAYVLEQSLTACNSPILEKLEMEVSEPRYVSHPSLDEMVEVSCSPIVSKRVRYSPKSNQKVAAIASGENTIQDITPNLQVEQRNQFSEIQVVDNSDVYMRNNDVPNVPGVEQKADRLSQLLKQCSILQDDIQKKLSIYF